MTTAPKPQDAAMALSDESLRQFPGYRMKRAVHLIQTQLATTLRPFDLRLVTYSILQLVVDNPGARPSHLSDALAIERPNMVALIEELIRMGALQKTRDPKDRRAISLQATDAGNSLCSRANAAVTAMEQQFFQGLSATSLGNLQKALTTVERNIRDISS